MSAGASLRAVCAQEDMPCKATVLKWCRDFPEFAAQYARAREDLLEHWADEIVDISDDSSQDTVEVKDDKGAVIREQQNSEWITRSRLRVDTRKWLMSKLAPRKYGEKLELSGDPERPLGVKIVRFGDPSAEQVGSAQVPDAGMAGSGTGRPPSSAVLASKVG